MQNERYLRSQGTDRVGKHTIWIRSRRRIEWYIARTGGMPVAVSRLKRRVAHQEGVRQGWGDPHWNPLAETIRMVYGSKR